MSSTPKVTLFKSTFICFSIFLISIMLFISQYYGITWDEWVESNNGMLALANIRTFGENDNYLTFTPGYLYSSLFYIVVETAYGLLHGDLNSFSNLHENQLIDFFNFSHAVNSIFGFIAMLYTGLLAQKIAGWRAGCLALLFMAISPRIFGSSMNNPKDIPFAAMYIVSIYYMSFFLANLPKLNLKNALLTAITIGLCIGTRTGGIILIFYLLAGSLIKIGNYIGHNKISGLNMLHLLLAGVGIVMISLHISFLFWPYGREHSYSDALNAVLELSQFKYWNYTMLFEGEMLTPAELPWYYIPKWILISSPLFLHIALMLGFISWLFKPHKRLNNTIINLVVLAAIFPMVFVIVRHSTVYSSWRHLFFVYPPLVILAALWWNAFLNKHIAKWKQLLIIGCLVLTCLEPLYWMLRNPKYAGTYFNPLVGGLKGAFLNYESDYWGSCMRESAEWLGKYHKTNWGETPAVILISGDLMRGYPFLWQALGSNYIPYGYPANFIYTNPFIVKSFPLDYYQPWNYAIAQVGGLSKRELINTWPPRGTIFTVRADDVPLCAVVKNDYIPLPK